VKGAIMSAAGTSDLEGVPLVPAADIGARAWLPQSAVAILAPLAVVAAIVLAWQAVTAGGHVSRLVLPAPSEIATAFVTAGPDLLANTGYTAAEAILGFIIGNAVGFGMAVVFVGSDIGRRTIYPLATAAQAVPIVAVTPALILWFGNGMAPKIFVTAFLTFFPMLVNALRGLRSADAEVNELLYTLSASPWQKLTIVRLPASTRFVFNAVKLSACACVVSALVAEWVAADRGLGFLVVLWSSQYKMAEVWAAVLTGTVLSMSLFGLAVLAERWATPWLVGRQRPHSP
jgi:ABC-type nitrate/sulfonate/bicarbonate transport system permease component